MRSGFAALIGRPNAGKSTLLNQLIGVRLAITSSKPQTTRRSVIGITRRPEGEVAFVDTPGLHTPHRALGSMMVRVSQRSAIDADAIICVFDALSLSIGGAFQADDELAFALLERAQKPSIAALSKIDKVAKPNLLPVLSMCAARFPFQHLIPVSGLTGDGVEELLQQAIAMLPTGEALYDDATYTDQSERELAGEYVREQVIRYCRQEIPYAVAVVVQEFDESRRSAKTGTLVRIEADILVDRASQKGIVIGKKGAQLKAIGTAARRSIEGLLECPVYLKLTVKVEPRWTQSAAGLGRAGLLSEMHR